MAAMIWAMEHFETNLRGRHFTVFTDHKPLETSGKKHERTLNRIKEAFMTWDFEIKYKKGCEMPADFLSRNVVESIQISDEDLATLQDKDHYCSSIKNLLNQRNEKQQGPRPSQTTTSGTSESQSKKTTSKQQGQNPSQTTTSGASESQSKKTTPTWKGQIQAKEAENCFVERDILWKRIDRYGTQTTVIVVPASIVKQLMSEVHGNIMYGHEGQYKTKERIIQSYWWPGMDNSINRHLKNCDRCQKTKKEKRQTTNFVSSLPQCTMPGQRIHMDLFGPLKTSGSGKNTSCVSQMLFPNMWSW
jgi:hypothetical protein